MAATSTTRVLAVCLALAAVTRLPEVAGSERNAPPWDREQVEAKACVPGQMSCSADCKSVLLDFCDGSDLLVVDTCDATQDMYCDYATASCVEGSKCVVPPNLDSLACHALGAFPNPYDCTKYHFCTVDTGVKVPAVDCPEDRAFDSLTGRCTLPLDSRPCAEGPVPHCDAPGQDGPQAENPNIYYVCVRTDGVLGPELFKCDSSDAFVNGKCELVVVTTSTTPTTTTPTTTTPTTTPTTTAATTTTPTTTTAATTTTTAATTTTPTTTAATSTTPTTTPTTTTAATTTTTAATTTTASAFSCSAQGQFPDPTDCHKYFLCSSSLLADSFTCQTGYHYDAFRGCVPGTCT